MQFTTGTNESSGLETPLIGAENPRIHDDDSEQTEVWRENRLYEILATIQYYPFDILSEFPSFKKSMDEQQQYLINTFLTERGWSINPEEYENLPETPHNISGTLDIISGNNPELVDKHVNNQAFISEHPHLPESLLPALIFSGNNKGIRGKQSKTISTEKRKKLQNSSDESHSGDILENDSFAEQFKRKRSQTKKKKTSKIQPDSSLKKGTSRTKKRTTLAKPSSLSKIISNKETELLKVLPENGTSISSFVEISNDHSISALSENLIHTESLNTGVSPNLIVSQQQQHQQEEQQQRDEQHEHEQDEHEQFLNEQTTSGRDMNGNTHLRNMGIEEMAEQIVSEIVEGQSYKTIGTREATLAYCKTMLKVKNIDDILGMEDLITVLCNSILKPILQPSLNKGLYGLGEKWRNIIHITGPSGSGRATTVLAFAKAIGARLVRIPGYIYIPDRISALVKLCKDSHNQRIIVLFDDCHQHMEEFSNERHIGSAPMAKELVYVISHLRATDVWWIISSPNYYTQLKTDLKNMIHRSKAVFSSPPRKATRYEFTKRLFYLHMTANNVEPYQKEELDAIIECISQSSKCHTFGDILDFVIHLFDYKKNRIPLAEYVKLGGNYSRLRPTLEDCIATFVQTNGGVSLALDSSPVEEDSKYSTVYHFSITTRRFTNGTRLDEKQFQNLLSKRPNLTSSVGNGATTSSENIPPLKRTKFQSNSMIQVPIRYSQPSPHVQHLPPQYRTNGSSNGFHNHQQHPNHQHPNHQHPNHSTHSLKNYPIPSQYDPRNVPEVSPICDDSGNEYS